MDGEGGFVMGGEEFGEEQTLLVGVSSLIL
jgi:hypothetical protein